MKNDLTDGFHSQRLDKSSNRTAASRVKRRRLLHGKRRVRLGRNAAGLQSSSWSSPESRMPAATECAGSLPAFGCDRGAPPWVGPLLARVRLPAGVAQLVERLSCKQGVRGSSPLSGSSKSSPDRGISRFRVVAIGLHRERSALARRIFFLAPLQPPRAEGVDRHSRFPPGDDARGLARAGPLSFCRHLCARLVSRTRLSVHQVDTKSLRC